MYPGPPVGRGGSKQPESIPAQPQTVPLTTILDDFRSVVQSYFVQETRLRRTKFGEILRSLHTVALLYTSFRAISKQVNE